MGASHALPLFPTSQFSQALVSVLQKFGSGAKPLQIKSARPLFARHPRQPSGRRSLRPRPPLHPTAGSAPTRPSSPRFWGSFGDPAQRSNSCAPSGVGIWDRHKRAGSVRKWERVQGAGVAGGTTGIDGAGVNEAFCTRPLRARMTDFIADLGCGPFHVWGGWLCLSPGRAARSILSSGGRGARRGCSGSAPPFSPVRPFPALAFSPPRVSWGCPHSRLAHLPRSSFSFPRPLF